MLLFAAYSPDFLVKFLLCLKRHCFALCRDLGNCVKKSCRLAAACFLSPSGLPVDAIKRKEHLITAFINFIFKHFNLIWIPPTPAALTADSLVCFWRPPSCHRRDRGPLRAFTQLLDSSALQRLSSLCDASAIAFLTHPHLFLILLCHLYLWNWFTRHCLSNKSAFSGPLRWAG